MLHDEALSTDVYVRFAPLSGKSSEGGCEFSSRTLDFDPEFFELAIERRSRETKNLSTSSDVAGSAFECLQDCFTLDLFHRHQRWYYKRGIAEARTLKLLRQAFGQQLISRAKQHGTFNDTLKFADVSGPIVPQQTQQQFPARDLEFFCRTEC